MRKAVGSGRLRGSKKRRTDEPNLDEIVEVARLERSVLPVVSEAEKLLCFRFEIAVSLQLGAGLRLNTHADSIERGGVHSLEPKLRQAFQSRNQTLRDDPETLCSKPKGYPFKLKAVGPDVGLQFFADVPLGRMFQMHSEVMAWLAR